MRRHDDARQFDHLHAAVAPSLVIQHGQTISVTHPPARSLVPPQTAAEDASKLPPESPPEEVVRHEINRGIQDNEEIAGFIQGVQREAFERLRVSLERPDDARYQRRRLTKEEYDDDSD